MGKRMQLPKPHVTAMDAQLVVQYSEDLHGAVQTVEFLHDTSVFAPQEIVLESVEGSPLLLATAHPSLPSTRATPVSGHAEFLPPYPFYHHPRPLTPVQSTIPAARVSGRAKFVPPVAKMPAEAKSASIDAEPKEFVVKSNLFSPSASTASTAMATPGREQASWEMSLIHKATAQNVQLKEVTDITPGIPQPVRETPFSGIAQLLEKYSVMDASRATTAGTGSTSLSSDIDHSSSPRDDDSA